MLKTNKFIIILEKIKKKKTNAFFFGAYFVYKLFVVVKEFLKIL